MEKDDEDFYDIQGYQLMYAAQEGCLECVQRLIERDEICVNYLSKHKQYNPLEFTRWGFDKAKNVVQQDNCKEVEGYLLSKGAMTIKEQLASIERDALRRRAHQIARGVTLEVTSSEPSGVWREPEEEAGTQA